MKLQLDTTNKIITLECNVNLGELTDLLEKMLPNGVWKEFTLEFNIIKELRNIMNHGFHIFHIHQILLNGLGGNQ